MSVFKKNILKRQYKGEQERRVEPDPWFYVSKISAVVSWLLFIIAMIISHFAAPDDDFGYLRYQQIEIRTDWLFPLTHYLVFTLCFSAFCSLVYLVLIQFRARRSNDHKHFNVLLLLMITLAWGLYIWMAMMS